MKNKLQWAGGILILFLVIVGVVKMYDSFSMKKTEMTVSQPKEIKTETTKEIPRDTTKKEVQKTTEPVVTESMKKLFSEYVSKNYPAWTIESMKYDPMCDGSEAYDVTLSNPKKEAFAIILSRESTLLQTETDAPVATMPVGIRNMLKRDYAEYSYGESYEQLTMANGEKRFLIDVTNNEDKKISELILREDGKTLCQSQPK